MTPRSGPLLAVIGVGALLLVAGLASTCSGADALRRHGDESAAVTAAAVAFVDASGTFDAQSAQTYIPRLAAGATGALEQALLAARIDPAASMQQRSNTIAVTSAAVSTLGANAATVMVVATQHRVQVEPVSGTRFEEVMAQHVSCRLVRAGGRWLVVQFQLVSQQPGSAAGSG